MTIYPQGSGLRRGLDLIIDAEWSPEQAMAVITLLDDLRERIWAHYEIDLCQKWREDCITEHNAEPSCLDDPDAPV
jgi:hypothetical protein